MTKILLVLVALPIVLFSCAPIPSPGNLEKFEFSKTDFVRLTDGERIAIIPDRPTASLNIQECVNKGLIDKIGKKKTVDVNQAYKAFYPVVESFPYLSETELFSKFAEPEIRQSSQKYDTRYIVIVGEKKQREEANSTYLLVGILVDGKSYTGIKSQVFDLYEKRNLVEINVEASAFSGGFVTIAVIYSVIAIPQATSVACYQLGSRLGDAFLTGKFEPIEPNNQFLDREDGERRKK